MKADQEIIENSLQEIIESCVEEGPQEKTQQLVSEDLKTFLSIFNEVKDPEEKIRKAIEFMRGRLSLSASPRFREFWEARKQCLPLFKEAISPKSRADLWQQYVDLSVEARRLKEILDEQSAFAYEQIDLAVQSLVQDLVSYEVILSQIPELELLLETISLRSRKNEYNQIQKELHFLNGLAAKINALRKEVIKTDMRIRSKNKLFEKLSESGDRIFPRRKELIKKISENFIEDVEAFVLKYCHLKTEPSIPLHALREEIKSLQSIAKVLTLNTHAFTETRLKLSGCWDLVKEWEKEKKKEFNEKKAVYQQNFEQVQAQVKEFEGFCVTEQDFGLIEKKYQELLQSMKGIELGRSEMKALRDQIELAKKPHEERKKSQIQESQDKERKTEELRFQKVQDFRVLVQSLVDSASEMSLEELVFKKSDLEETYKNITASKAEKALLDRVFKQLKDKMLEAKSRSLLSLSHGEQEQYAGLKQVLKEKEERRREMKDQLEIYRKALAGSSFDFEKAIACRELMEVEKESLEKINIDIREIEKKIAEIKG